MDLQTAIEILEYHQKWRLGEREIMIHEPKRITEALDIVLNEVKNRSESVVGQSELLKAKEQICYKNNEPCKYDCSGLCKESC